MARAARREGESDEAMDRRLRSQYVDVCRFLLPAASLANVGMTVNARVLENVIRKMLSHRLMEGREIGEQAKAVARAEVPTLVKYAEAAPYLVDTIAELSQLDVPVAHETGEDFCTLVDYDLDGEENIGGGPLSFWRHGDERGPKLCAGLIRTSLQ